jgi:predicted RNA binding protein YcfA (HicA-like mRNA interferase family)
MDRKKKVFLRFLRSPKSLKYRDIEYLLLKAGFREVSTRGSHKKFVHTLTKKQILIPIHRNECKNCYKYKIAKIVSKYFFIIIWSHFITQLHSIIRSMHIQ